MDNSSNPIRVNVTIDISGDTLQTIVQTAKEMVGRNEKGHYRIDTADLLEDLLSRFIEAHHFDDFVANRNNYGFLEDR